jgi:phasin family protein
MYPTLNRFVDLQKSQFDAINAIALALVNATESVTNLNLAAARTLMEQSYQNTEVLLEQPQPQQAFAMVGAAVQPAADKLVNYSRSLYGIALGTHAELSKIVETKVDESNELMTELFEAALPTAPVGTEGALALFQGALAASKPVWEAVSQSARRATELAATNVSRAAPVGNGVAKTKSRKAT